MRLFGFIVICLSFAYCFLLDLIAFLFDLCSSFFVFLIIKKLLWTRFGIIALKQIPLLYAYDVNLLDANLVDLFVESLPPVNDSLDELCTRCTRFVLFEKLLPPTRPLGTADWRKNKNNSSFD